MKDTAETPQARDVTLDLQRIFFLANELEREVARALGVSPTDYRALSALMQTGPLTVGQLAAAIGATYATTTALANRLEAAGHIRRARIDTDQRKVHLYVEDSTAARVLDLMRDPMEDALIHVEHLPGPARAAVAEFTSTIAALLEGHLATLTARDDDTRPHSPRKDRS